MTRAIGALMVAGMPASLAAWAVDTFTLGEAIWVGCVSLILGIGVLVNE